MSKPCGFLVLFVSLLLLLFLLLLLLDLVFVCLLVTIACECVCVIFFFFFFFFPQSDLSSSATQLQKLHLTTSISVIKKKLTGAPRRGEVDRTLLNTTLTPGVSKDLNRAPRAKETGGCRVCPARRERGGRDTRERGGLAN